jgi:hypothetical protein
MIGRKQDDGRAVLEPAEFVTLAHIDVAGVVDRPARPGVEQEAAITRL